MFDSHGIKLITQIYNAFKSDTHIPPANYYLCADLHFYQTGILTITQSDNDSIQINQIVSGTGGADLDTIVPPGKLTGGVPGTNTQFELTTYQSVKSYGYTIISDQLDNGQLSIIFKPVQSQPDGTGGRKPNLINKKTQKHARRLNYKKRKTKKRKK